MKHNLKLRTLLERGGLMIEALAMLGLIAVVTPTMYKKSAERTMEVDDINTATTIRSYISAAESYMATNYISLMKEFQDEAAESAETDPELEPEEEVEIKPQYKPLENDDLADFLPYKFKSANSLYDFNEPQVTVVRNGNNLTAFLLFPAKGAGDDGLGQERTARIASLVGANGGYVRSERNARGIGGIWSLSGETYDNVFPGDNPHSPVYSIVASTPNAINGSTQIGEFENPKYLQRTFECPDDATEAEKEKCKEEETWRNTMRTDLYLGGYNKYDELPDDNPTDETMHNIRNIGSLIVGAEEQADIDGSTSYGLYIAEDLNNTATTTDDDTGEEVSNPNPKSSAYIGGSLMAGLRKFFVNDTSLNYGPITRENEEHEEEIAHYNFTVDSATGNMRQHGDVDIARDFYSNSISHESYSNSKILMGAGDAYSYFVMKAQRYVVDSDNLGEKLIFMGSGDGGLVRIDSDTNYDAFSEGDKIHGGQFNINYAHHNKRGSVMVQKKRTEDGHTVIEEEEKFINNIDYQANQKFPVAIGSNTYVQGLLAADQVDTQKLRTASFSTGSAHVDDAHQWLNVDKDGVVIESTEQNSDENNTTKTKVNVNDSGVEMRYGGTDEAPEAILVLKSDTFSDDSSPTGSRTDYAIVGEADNITMKTENDGVLSLRNDMIEQAMMHTQMDFGFLDDVRWDGYSNYDVNFHTDGVVNLIGSNLRAGYVDSSNNKHNVFSVNTQSDFAHLSGVLPDSSMHKISGTDNPKNYPSDFSVAMHGNVLFTDEHTGSTGHYNGHNRRYMSIGQQTDVSDNAAGIEIVADNDDVNAHKAVMVDLSNNNTNNIVSYTYNSSSKKFTTDNDFNIESGTVYIRKGGMDVLPDIPTSTDYYSNNGGALERRGFIAAPRFVANNRDANGNLVEVPNILNDSVYKTYNADYNGTNRLRNSGVLQNTSDKKGRYDTYMVNPAYTSVMHDIKLTTRGGARLSDILPNFIIKSIYVSTNDKDDSFSDFKFQHTGTEVKCGGSSCPVAGSNPWASPYTGYVPRPQCPPGYSSVITFTPVSFAVAQAGQMTYNSSSRAGGSKYHVEENLMNSNAEYYTGGSNGKGDEANIRMVTPMFRQGKVGLADLAEGDSHRMVMQDSYSRDTYYVHDIHGLEVAGHDDGTSTAYPYVLTVGSKEKGAQPFIFQQNTWLKTLSVPMCAGVDSYYRSNGNDCMSKGKYVNSWALLMGFVYTGDIYKTYLTGGSSYTDSRLVHSKEEISLADNNGVLYWNVFPVNKYSLEGTATTYCYFNRSNLTTVINDSQATGVANAFTNGYEEILSEDKYLSLQDTSIPNTYMKEGNDAYVKRLNDPTLKYTEEW